MISDDGHDQATLLSEYSHSRTPTPPSLVSGSSPESVLEQDDSSSRAATQTPPPVTHNQRTGSSDDTFLPEWATLSAPSAPSAHMSSFHDETFHGLMPDHASSHFTRCDSHEMPKPSMGDMHGSLTMDSDLPAQPWVHDMQLMGMSSSHMMGQMSVTSEPTQVFAGMVEQAPCAPLTAFETTQTLPPMPDVSTSGPQGLSLIHI